MRRGKKSASQYDQEIGGRLRLARLRADVRQADAARHVGITSNQLRNYELGVNRISAVLLAILARLYGRPVACFLDGVIPGAEPATERSVRALVAARVNAEIRRNPLLALRANVVSEPVRPLPVVEPRRELPPEHIEPKRQAAEPRRKRLDGSERRERSARMRREAATKKNRWAYRPIGIF